MTTDKNAQRLLLKQIRGSIQDRESKNISIAKNALELIDNLTQNKKNHLNIMLYKSFRDEVNTNLISSSLKNSELYYPLCLNNNLLPVFIKDEELEMEVGSYGITSPLQSLLQNKERIATPNSIDIIIVPGLGFDRKGNRLGYGKGYYDKFLVNQPSAIKIALCFEAQIVPEIISDEYDIKMDYLVTENNCFEISN